MQCEFKTLIGALLLAMAVQPAVAQYRDRVSVNEAVGSENVAYAYADVIRVDPVYETVRFLEPGADCAANATGRAPAGRRDATGSTVIGAVIGGVIGSQIGRGDGRRAATVAGAAVGGAIGHQVASNSAAAQAAAAASPCEGAGAEREERRIAGYDVEYRLKGDIFVSRLDYDPGNKLRVRITVTPAD